MSSDIDSVHTSEVVPSPKRDPLQAPPSEISSAVQPGPLVQSEADKSLAPAPSAVASSEELITIIVDIGDGREESIVVHFGDLAGDLAAEFAKKHGLDLRMQKKLERHVQENIDIAMAEEAQQDISPPRQPGTEPIQELSCGSEESPAKSAASPVDQQLEGLLRWRGSTPKRSPVVPMTKLPVHERLHMQAMNKQRAGRVSQESGLVALRGAEERGSQSLRPSSSDRNSLNYGQRLYEKGVKKLEERDRECQEVIKDRELEERKLYTFKPTIDANSEELAREVPRERLEDRLIMAGQALQARKKQQHTASLVEDKLKCTFHPEVNKKYCFRT